MKSDFNNDFENKRDDWSRVKVGNDWKNVRDNEFEKGRTSTHSKA